MNEDVKKCVVARVNFFDEYYIIPPEVENEVNSFKSDISKLGENCKDATTFEKKFISTGLSEQFNTILPKCIPKAVKMTKEQKLQSLKTTKDIIKDNKKEIIKDAVKDVGTTVFNNIKDEGIAKRREKMIEDGTFDDYTIARNNLDNGNILFNFFRSKFKKKQSK